MAGKVHSGKKFSRRGSKRCTRFVVLNEEELIRQVSLRPILYDRSLKSYRKSGLRLQYWKEVSDEMNATLEECRRRWRSLRDAFTKHFKHMNKAGDDATVKRKKWVFYDQMSFIAPYLDSASCEIDELLDDFGDNSEDDDVVMMCSKAEEHDSEAEQQLARTEPASKASDIDKSKFVTLLQEETALAVAANDFVALPEEVSVVVDERSLNTTEEQDRANRPAIYSSGPKPQITDLDCDERFLLSCAPTLRRLSYRKNSLARLKIQQILFDIEFGAQDT